MFLRRLERQDKMFLRETRDKTMCYWETKDRTDNIFLRETRETRQTVLGRL